ncbi:protein arginine N-methyltransferase 2 isoform X2 [Triticum aestivum]|uniref:protein arginine N-methyltransferase 2 isoform X2 n=1 Tax=Triticum aestivum TaxID=4565 RepID=UPI001D007D4E|nr:protein arginine N-methyltransferase 2-like isoform X2 [Triticum aestivum]
MAAPPDSKSDKSPEELLCAAAEAGNDDAIAEIISSGADPTYFDASGMTPLMRAASGGHAAAARLLLDAGAPWNALSPEGLSAGDLTSDPATYDLLLDHALRSELILGTVARRQAASANSSDGVPAETYLDSRVSFSEDRVMDAESKAVMMEWERPLMEAHARAVCAAGGGKVLNVGFGMGLVDQAIQRYEPEEHTIIEAHPEVYARMLKLGWGEKKNVRILFGRWQDVIPQLGSYDGPTRISQEGDTCRLARLPPRPRGSFLSNCLKGGLFWQFGCTGGLFRQKFDSLSLTKIMNLCKEWNIQIRDLPHSHSKQLFPCSSTEAAIL